MPIDAKQSKKLSEALARPLSYMGIYRSDSLDDQSISLRTYVVFAILGTYVILSLAYFAFASTTFQSYADCFWITATSMLETFIGVTLIVKRKMIFQLIDSFDSVIENRKKNTTHIEYAFNYCINSCDSRDEKRFKIEENLRRCH